MVYTASSATRKYFRTGKSSWLIQSILRKNLIRNCPVTSDDAKRTLIIYGPNFAAGPSKEK
jgi:hypothetical protein